MNYGDKILDGALAKFTLRLNGIAYSVLPLIMTCTHTLCGTAEIRFDDIADSCPKIARFIDKHASV